MTIINHQHDEETGDLLSIQSTQTHELKEETPSASYRALRRITVSLVLALGLFAAVSSSQAGTTGIDDSIDGAVPLASTSRRALSSCPDVQVDFSYKGGYIPPLDRNCPAGSLTYLELLYRGGSCPSSSDGSCQDFNGGPPAQGLNETVYVVVTAPETGASLYNGATGPGGDIHLRNGFFQPIPSKVKVEIYGNCWVGAGPGRPGCSRSEWEKKRSTLLQVATIDSICPEGSDVMFQTVGSSQIVGFQRTTSIKSRTSVLVPYDAQGRVALTVSAKTNGIVSSQRVGGDNIQLTSINIKNGLTGKDLWTNQPRFYSQQTFSTTTGTVSINSVTQKSGSVVQQLSFDATLAKLQRYPTTVAGSFKNPATGQNCAFSKANLFLMDNI